MESIPAFWYYMIVVQIVGIISTVLAFAFSWFRDNRNRNWDLQDRALARAHTEEKFSEVHSSITEAKTEASKAFTEANHAKELISSIEEVRNNIQHKTLEIAENMKNAASGMSSTIEDIQNNTAKTADSLEKLTNGPLLTIPTERRKN